MKRTKPRTSIRLLISAGVVTLGLATGALGGAGTANATVGSGAGGSGGVGDVWCLERTALSGRYGATSLPEGINIKVSINPEASANWTNQFTSSFNGAFTTLGSQKVGYNPWLYNVTTKKWMDLGWRTADISKPELLTTNYRAPDSTPKARYQVFVYFSWLRPTGWTAAIGEYAPSYSTNRFNSYAGLGQSSATTCDV